MATMIAWNMTAQRVAAEEGGSSGSGVSTKYWMKCDKPDATEGQTGIHIFGLTKEGLVDADPVGWKQITGPEGQKWYRCFLCGVIESQPVKDAAYGYDEKECKSICKGRFCMVTCEYDGHQVAAPSQDTENSEGFDGWTNWESIVRIASQWCVESNGEMGNSPTTEDAEQPDDIMDSGLRIETSMNTSPTPDTQAVNVTMELYHPQTNRSCGVIDAYAQFTKEEK